MTIKIKSIDLDKDVIRKEIVGGTITPVINKLEGRLLLELKVGDIIGDSKVKIGRVSEKLQDELYSVLKKIEEELNEDTGDKNTFNVSKYKWDLNQDVESEVSKIINEKLLKLQDEIDIENSRKESTQNITFNVEVASNKEFNVEEFTKQIMTKIKRGRGI